ncbi:MAG: thrombospondin type 3 repeat-containing protein [Pseudohongiellaceae bacterium]
MKLNNLKKSATLLLISLLALTAMVNQAQAAEASARHYTAKPYIFDGERQAFYLDINNTSSSSFRVVRTTISFTENVEIRGLDGDCSLSRPSNLVQITCILPQVKANSFERISYDIVGDLDFRAGFEVSATISSPDGDITIQDQDASAEGVADNDLLIEGPTLNLVVARDVLRDSDSDGISDMSEIAMGTDPSNASSFSNANAIIDVAVLQSEETDRYYGGKFGSRVEALLAATNQQYRDNNIAITLRLVALGTVDYDSADKDISLVAEEFFALSGESFSNVDIIKENTGADLVVFAHPLFRDSDGTEDSGFFCGIGLTNTEAVQGDFYQELFGSRMLSVISSSLNCSGRGLLTSLFALNMGVAISRQESIEGGTFSFSAGYVEEGYFASYVPSTIDREATSEAPELGSNMLSNPEKLCFGRPCGIDKSNLATGADAVFSLNATRHSVAELAPTVKPVSSEDLEHKVTINSNNVESIQVRQFGDVKHAVTGDWVSVRVEATNTSAVTLHHLEVSVGSSFQPLALRSSDNQCSILAQQGSSVVQDLLGANEGVGRLTCFVNQLAPGATAGFSYSLQIGNSTRSFFGQDLFSVPARVNNETIRESQACFSVSDNALQQAIALDVCPAYIEGQSRLLDPRRQFDGINPNLLPELSGSVFTIPFIRLFDDELVSAMFKVSGETSRRYELIDINYLSSDVFPVTTAQYSEEGILTINKAVIEGLGGYSLTLRLDRLSNPPIFIETAISRQ